MRDFSIVKVIIITLFLLFYTVDFFNLAKCWLDNSESLPRLY